MTATDRFRETLPPHLEDRARELARTLRGSGNYPVQYAFLLGYLEGSIATALERPRWRSRDRLAVDLRAVQMVSRHEVDT